MNIIIIFTNNQLLYYIFTGYFKIMTLINNRMEGIKNNWKCHDVEQKC